MSIAGKRSSLGDEYQLCIALHWLIRLLEDDTIEGIQVDSTGIPGENSSVTVDDIVVLYKNGHADFIQAKKNQTDHKAWSFSDKVLKDELCKARDLLQSRANSKVWLYSRSPFGDLASLVENCRYLPEYSAFKREAPEKQQESLATLAKVIERSEEITYSLVTKIYIGSPQGFEEWERQNELDLERIVPMANVAKPILERYLQSHQTNLRDTKYVVTRSDILNKLSKEGIILTPQRSESEILTTFKRSSSIGRNWLRTIDGQLIPRSELSLLIELIKQGCQTILLTDCPGSGKTCLLLDLADYIEHEKTSVWGLLFIKGDQFINVGSEKDLVAEGLPEDIVGHSARLAKFRRTVVIIDSLDVLSHSRQHETLKVFLRIIDRLEKIKGVTVITASRHFDLKYDPLLRGRSWEKTVNLQPLDFENYVKPFLVNWKVDLSKITPELQALLQIPQNLRIYEKLAKLGYSTQPASTYELYHSFLEEVIVKNPILGSNAITALQNMAEQLTQRRTKSYSKLTFGGNEEIIRQLKSQEILLENTPNSLEFSHQTLKDCITVRAALTKNQSLAQFILTYPQLPFIRPTVRAFFFYLRASQPDAFRRQVWEVLSHNDIAYHIQRLICESLSEISPVREDWRLLHRIFQNIPDLFKRLLWKVNNHAWFDFLTQSWLQYAQSSSEKETWLLQFIQHLNVWMNVYSVEVVKLWRQAIEEEWANQQNLASIISYVLGDFQALETEGTREILEYLMRNINSEHDFVGHRLSRWVESTNSGDDLLWEYITRNVLEEDINCWRLDHKLRCQPNDFYKGDFLEKRLCQSETLLTLVLDKLEHWSEVSTVRDAEQRLHNKFLHFTSWEIKHSRRDIYTHNDLNYLLSATEKAIKYHVRHNTSWWLQNETRLQNSQDLALCYFLIEAYKENLCHSQSIKFWILFLILNTDFLAGILFLNNFFHNSILGIELLLQDIKLLSSRSLNYEISELIRLAYPKISKSAQDTNQKIILSLLSEEEGNADRFGVEVYRDLYNLCISIPAIFRNEDIQEFIDIHQDYFGYTESKPKIRSWSGFVIAPLSPQHLLNLSNEGIFKLLRYYQERRDRIDTDIVGGFSEVKSVLREACSLYPERFVVLFSQFVEEHFYKDYGDAVVQGVTLHLRYRFGNVKSPKQWKPVDPLPKGEKLAATLLNWLERYSIIWEDGNTVRDALEACCQVLIDNKSVERLSLLLFWLYKKYPSDRETRKDSQDINIDSAALNSIHGVAALSTVRLCNRLLEQERSVPELLRLLLSHVAGDTAIYVRLSVLLHLPFLIYKKPDWGWQLLTDIFEEPQTYLWKHIEKCLYYQYRENFEKVAPYLNRILNEGMEEAGDTWGRISTLASLAGHINQEDLFEVLEENENQGAWRGVTQVFTANLHLQEHTEQCISGLIRILRQSNFPDNTLLMIDKCFEEEDKRIFISPDLACGFVEALSSSTRYTDFNGFLQWLSYESHRDPLFTLKLTEILAEKIELMGNARFSRTQPLISALNEILREADEIGEPQLIQRAINLQDQFLRLGIYGMDEFLDQAGQN